MIRPPQYISNLQTHTQQNSHFYIPYQNFNQQRPYTSNPQNSLSGSNLQTSESRRLSTSNTPVLTPQNVSIYRNSASKPYLSPEKNYSHEKRFSAPPENKNVDDIVSQCLSRTQKLIEGIKKTHDPSIPNSNNAPNNPITTNTRQNFHFSVSPNRKKQILLTSTVIKPHSSISPSRIVIQPTPMIQTVIRTSPSRYIHTTPSPVRLHTNNSVSPISTRRLSGSLLLSPSFISSEIESYKGDILDNKPHGRGICTYKSGYKYEGEFNLGLKHGFGTLKSANGESIYSGDWELGKFQGDGIFINPLYEPNSRDESDLEYENLSNLTKNWVRYEGGFFEGKMNDLGTLHFFNGEKFRGKFVNGRVNGEGSYYKNSGDIIMGFWENGILQEVF